MRTYAFVGAFLIVYLLGTVGLLLAAIALAWFCLLILWIEVRDMKVRQAELERQRLLAQFATYDYLYGAIISQQEELINRR